MTETSDHDVAMTSLLCVSGLESPGESRDVSYHDNNIYLAATTTSTTQSPSVALSDNDYSASVHMTSQRSNETSLWLSDAQYSASMVSVNDSNIIKQQQKMHPRFMDISYKSAQLSDSYYTPPPRKETPSPKRRRPVLGVNALTLRHITQQPYRPQAAQQVAVPPQAQGIKRKVMCYDQIHSDSSLFEDSRLQVLIATEAKRCHGNVIHNSSYFQQKCSCLE